MRQIVALVAVLAIASAVAHAQDNRDRDRKDPQRGQPPQGQQSQAQQRGQPQRGQPQRGQPQPQVGGGHIPTRGPQPSHMPQPRRPEPTRRNETAPTPPPMQPRNYAHEQGHRNV